MRELQALALDETRESFEVIIKIRNDTGEDSKVRLAAAKLLIAYGIGEPPKEVRIENDRGGDAMDELTVEELRALARQSLTDETPEADDDADDDDGEADEAEH
ncbi:MAG: hypothetical protein IPJ65_42850 [Archangiaceae bacterium]|nr:hypothetical protein [Archangiaceae bacterium]